LEAKKEQAKREKDKKRHKVKGRVVPFEDKKEQAKKDQAEFVKIVTLSQHKLL